ncbi:MAG TPA: MFS transporter [Thermoplasmata archaeon]|nr:MFS transporter [Thermoplasmata archaeon]
MAGALQLAAPSAVLVVLIFTVTLAYPAGERATYGALALAFLGLAATVPTLVSMFVSGPLTDRHDRGVLMRAVNLIGVVATLGLVADLLYAPSARVPIPGPAGFYMPVWLLALYPAWAAIAVTTTLFRPAFNTSIARLVAARDLGIANGAIYATAAAVSTVCTLTVGVLLSVGSDVYALGIAFGLFFATQVALLMVDVDLAVRRRSAPRSLLAEARAGYSFLFRRRGLFEITLLALVVNLFAAMAMVEMGLYIGSWLGLTEGFWYGAMIAAGTAGVAVGFLLIPHLKFEPRAGRVILLLSFVYGAALLSFGLVRFIGFALAIYFVYGAVAGMFTNVFLSTVQATVPDEMMGRVFSADELGSSALIPVGQFVGGLLVLVVTVRGSFLLAGAAILVFAVVMLFTFGAMRGLSYQPRRSPDGELATS